MIASAVFARVVAAVGAVAVAVRHSGDGPRQPVYGTSPEIPFVKAQCTIPTLKIPTAKGWKNGHTPSAAAGL